MVDTTIDVPGQRHITVPASWPARAGQRFASVDVNAARSLFEPNYANNIATRFYTASGDEADLSVSADRRERSVVDAAKLTITGNASITLVSPGHEDVHRTSSSRCDRDGASRRTPTSRSALRSSTPASRRRRHRLRQRHASLRARQADASTSSANAVSETDETNNLTDLWKLCPRRVRISRPRTCAPTPAAIPRSATFVVRVGNNGSATAVQSGVSSSPSPATRPSARRSFLRWRQARTRMSSSPSPTRRPRPPRSTPWPTVRR